MQADVQFRPHEKARSNRGPTSGVSYMGVKRDQSGEGPNFEVREANFPKI